MRPHQEPTFAAWGANVRKGPTLRFGIPVAKHHPCRPTKVSADRLNQEPGNGPLRNVVVQLDARDVEISHETVRIWRHRFRLVFVAEIRNGLSTGGWS